MIQNLNQETFRKFGTILPERASSERVANPEESSTVAAVTKGAVQVYRAVADTWLYYKGHSAVLSASEDGKAFLRFYLLDKPVCVKAGIWFGLEVFQQDTQVELVSKVTPELAGQRRPNESLQIQNRLHIGSLYTFFYQEKEQGFFFGGEAHAMPELTYVDRGTLHSVADGQDTLLEQGQMTIYAPGQWHMQYADVGVAPRFVTITFDLEGENLAGLYNRRIQAPQQAVELLQNMIREWDRMDDYSNDMIIAQLSMLLLTILRQTDTEAAQKLQPTNSVRNENEIIRRAQQYINAHIREKLSVPLVARKADVSPSYLTALFHKHLQISPGEYIRRIKLQESKQMIREGNMNFTEIAEALQYSTVHHFSRQFKEKFGITPTEYAKSVR